MVGGSGIGFAAADNGDVPATARNEMVDGHATGVHIVTGDRTIFGIGGGAVDVDQWHAPVMAKRGPGVGFALHDEWTVDLEGPQFLDMLTFQRGVATRSSNPSSPTSGE